MTRTSLDCLLQRICVFTGSRAEYGIVKPLLERIREEPDLDLAIIASGSHLAPEHGRTVEQILADGFAVAEELEILLASDTPAGTCKAAGLAMIGLGEAFRRLAPDILVLVGDRYETLAAAFAATVCRLPIAHLHGGEASFGAMDEAFRHAITKMAHLHFTSTEAYRQRVIQLGEDPAQVFFVGALALEGLSKTRLLDRAGVEQALGLSLGERAVLVTFHPATADPEPAADQIDALVAVLAARDDLTVVCTRANADPAGRLVNARLEELAARAPGRVALFSALGSPLYWSTMAQVAAVVGNSSSGIIEAPSLHVPTLNIGDRQAGRVRAESVIDCAATAGAISAGLERVLSVEMQGLARQTANPYEKDNTAAAILAVLRSTAPAGLGRKVFHDLPGSGAASLAGDPRRSSR
ncbi:MAG: UDP-N-acetylglucosamine 2-epimerase [Thermodesulfobacteriota bacterium]